MLLITVGVLCVCSQCRWSCVGDVAFCTCNEFNLSRVSLLQLCVTAFKLKIQRDLADVILYVVNSPLMSSQTFRMRHRCLVLKLGMSIRWLELSPSSG